jgi:hypothetical protein
MVKQTREERNKDKREYWTRQITLWEKSGLSQIEYCKRNNLSRHVFTYWKCKGNKKQESLSFVPVLRKPTLNQIPVNRIAPIRIMLGSRYRIEIEDGFSPDTLGQLMYALERM